MRKISYMSGTRANFGLMQASLQTTNSSRVLKLDVVATGLHLSERSSLTMQEFEETGLDVAARIPFDTDHSAGAAMARNKVSSK